MDIRALDIEAFSRVNRIIWKVIRITGTFPLDQQFRPSIFYSLLSVVHISLKCYCYVCLVTKSNTTMLIMKDLTLVSILLEIVLHGCEFSRGIVAILMALDRRERLRTLVEGIYSMKLRPTAISEVHCFYFMALSIWFLALLNDSYLSPPSWYLQESTALYYSNWICLASSVGQWIAFTTEVGNLFPQLEEHPLEIPGTLRRVVRAFDQCDLLVENYNLHVFLMVSWIFIFLVNYTFVYISLLTGVWSIPLPSNDHFTIVLFHVDFVFWLLTVMVLLQCVFMCTSHVKSKADMTSALTGIRLQIWKCFRYFSGYPLDENFQVSLSCLLFTSICSVVRLYFYQRLLRSGGVYAGLPDEFVTRVSTTVELVVHLVESITSVVSIVFLTLRRDRLKAIDSRLRFIGQTSTKTGRSVRYLSLGFALWALSACLDVLVSIEKNSVQMEYILFYYNWLSFAGKVDQWVLLLDVIVSRYPAADEILDTPQQKLLKSIECINSICKSFLEVYELQMLMLVGWYFIYLVHIVFSYIILSPTICFVPLDFTFKSFAHLFSFLAEITWLISSGTQFMCIFVAVGEFRSKERKFNETLYWRMVEDKEGTLLNDEFLNFHFMAKQEVEFTACGFFTLDNSLLCSMLVTATTYLVIVLQYSQGSPSPSTIGDDVTTNHTR